MPVDVNKRQHSHFTVSAVTEDTIRNIQYKCDHLIDNHILLDTLLQLKYAGFAVPANSHHRARWHCHLFTQGETSALCGTAP